MYYRLRAMLCATFLLHLLASRIDMSVGPGAKRWQVQGLSRPGGRLFHRGSLPCCLAKKAAVKKPSGFGGGFGKATVAKTVDGKQQLKTSMRDLEKIDKLGKNDWYLIREYMLSARLKPDAEGPKEDRLSDWLPCAAASVISAAGVELEEQQVDDALASLTPAVHAALAQAISSAKKLSQQDFQFGYESYESFDDHVLSVMMKEEKFTDKMTKREAFDVFGIDADADYSKIRRTYRQLSAKFHPDVSDAPDAEEKYKRLQTAYATLCASDTMTGKGWFESLGGDDREFKTLEDKVVTEFNRPADIKSHVASGGVFAAVQSIDPALTNQFALATLQNLKKRR